jgi:hypothetical protein
LRASFVLSSPSLYSRVSCICVYISSVSFVYLLSLDIPSGRFPTSSFFDALRGKVVPVLK